MRAVSHRQSDWIKKHILPSAERFLRMWEYYLAHCESAFRERYISDVQLVLSKVTNRNQLMNEPKVESMPEAAWQECSH